MKQTVENFINSPLRNSYVRYKDLEIYLRKGPYYIDGIAYKNVFQRASTKNIRRSNNMVINPKIKRTGLYREFDDLMFKLAKENGFDGILVECVLNDFLGEKLLKMGYKKVNEGTGEHYFRKVS